MVVAIMVERAASLSNGSEGVAGKFCAAEYGVVDRGGDDGVNWGGGRVSGGGYGGGVFLYQHKRQLRRKRIPMTRCVTPKKER